MPELFRLITGSDPIRFAHAPERLVELLRTADARLDTLRALTYLLGDTDEVRLRTLDVIRQVFEKADAAAFDGLTRLVGAGLCDDSHRATIEEALRHGLTAPSRECQSGVSRLLLRLLAGPAPMFQPEQRAAWHFVTVNARAESTVVRRAFAELLGRLMVVTGCATNETTSGSQDSMARWIWTDEVDYPSAKAWAGSVSAATLFASNRQVRGRAAMSFIGHLREPGDRGDAAIEALVDVDLPRLLEQGCAGEPRKLEELWQTHFPSYGPARSVGSRPGAGRDAGELEGEVSNPA